MHLAHGRIRKDLETHIVIDVEDGTKNPSSCHICSQLLRSADDLSAVKAFGCCDMCAQTWVRPNRERWATGWRPGLKEVENGIYDRPPLIVAF